MNMGLRKTLRLQIIIILGDFTDEVKPEDISTAKMSQQVEKFKKVSFLRLYS